MPFVAPVMLDEGYDVRGPLQLVQGSYSAMPQNMTLKGSVLEEQPQRSSSSSSSSSSSQCTKCVVIALLLVFFLEVIAIALIVYCRALPVDRTSQALPLLKKFGGRETYQASDLPGKRDAQLFNECEAGTSNRTVRDGMVFGYAKPADALEILYRCTGIPGLVEEVPQVLRGIFWMKGNPLPEELAVLQMGQWFEEERTYILPFAPFMWAWTEGHPQPEPSLLPFGLLAQYGRDVARRGAAFLATARYTLSFKFRECPGRSWMPWPFGLPGHSCQRGLGTGPDLQYAEIQEHPGGDLTVNEEDTECRMEALPEGAASGALWHRGTYGGPSWLGGCRCISIGSYTLVKVIDGNGLPFEPYYSEFLQYMGDTPLLLWTGVMQQVPEDDP